MLKARTLFIFGILIAVLPYLGFPYFWKNIMYTLLGLGLAFFSYIMHRESNDRNKEKKSFENFSENNFNDN